MTTAPTLVTFEEISRWLLSREPWPREILTAIARAASRSTDGKVSSNHLLHDPEFVIADNQVNVIPAVFRSCVTHGWLTKTGTEPTESAGGHGRDIKVYEVTPEGKTALARVAEIGTGATKSSPPGASPDLDHTHGTEVGVDDTARNDSALRTDAPPTVVNPDLGVDSRPNGPGPSTGTTGETSGGATSPALPDALPLPGLEPIETPSHIDPDQREVA